MILKSKDLLSLLLMFSCFFLSAKDVTALVPEKGVFLVAGEEIADPRFRDRVVLLIQHDDQGSAGLVVNRSSRLLLSTVLPKESQLKGEDKVLSYGGPVEPNTLLALVKVRNHAPEPSDAVIGKLYITGVGVLENWPDFAEEVLDYRAFSGYSGWAPGQLAKEMARGDWQVVPGDDEKVFASGGVDLWDSLKAEFLEQE